MYSVVTMESTYRDHYHEELPALRDRIFLTAASILTVTGGDRFSCSEMGVILAKNTVSRQRVFHASGL